MARGLPATRPRLAPRRPAAKAHLQPVAKLRLVPLTEGRAGLALSEQNPITTAVQSARVELPLVPFSIGLSVCSNLAHKIQSS